MSKKRKLAFDDSQILNISNGLVDKILQPQMLGYLILNHIEEEDSEDLLALRTAIDFHYPELRKRFEGGERDDTCAELTAIDGLVNFYIGVAVGRCVR